MKYCKVCGKEIDDRMRFCPYCGAPVGEPVSPTGDLRLQETDHFPTPEKNKRKIFVMAGIFVVILLAAVILIKRSTGFPNVLCRYTWVEDSGYDDYYHVLSFEKGKAGIFRVSIQQQGAEQYEETKTYTCVPGGGAKHLMVEEDDCPYGSFSYVNGELQAFYRGETAYASYRRLSD